VYWRREARDSKPTKRPYNARSARPASSTAPRTWSSFEQAKAAYLERPDFFDGIGYVFSKDDSYCGADFDHCIGDTGAISTWAAERIAALQAAGAYTEISVSGSGVHAITRATVGKGRKTVRGEIYDRARFFTFSGNRLAGSTPIGDGQAAIDALAAELGGPASAGDKPARDAGQPTAHSEVEWEQARQLLRTERDRLLKRFLAATQKEETQGVFRCAWSVGRAALLLPLHRPLPRRR
jgi:primase-polymerase (primpol)-like protein